MGIFKKKSADEAIQELVDSLSAALGPTLVSVLVYGSKASGEYLEERSDINIFIVLSSASEDTLTRMAKPLGEWTKAGHPVPVFLQASELPIYANSLPIEFLDMQDHHQVVFGTNPLDGLKIDLAHLRAQCAQELAVKLLKLRQAILLADGNTKRLRHILTESLPSVLTLYRAVLRLESEVPKGNKIEAANALAGRVGFDPDFLERLRDLHIRRQTDNTVDIVQHYLDSLERVLVYLARQ